MTRTPTPDRPPHLTSRQAGASRLHVFTRRVGGPVATAIILALLFVGAWLLLSNHIPTHAGRQSSLVSTSTATAPSSPHRDEPTHVHGTGPAAGHVHDGSDDEAADPADPPTTRATLPPGTWNGSEPEQPQDQQTAPTTPALASPTLPTGTQVDSPDGWRPVVEGFGKDWANPYGGKAAWLARITRWCSPQLATGFADTDINAVPTGTLVTIKQVVGGGEVADVRLTYASGLKTLVRAVIGAQGWKVVSIEPDKG